ncbi:MAG: DUF1800 domain-containing protein [Armatimonadetes bacterium]|nr:DUF1800 domain-containing protein [Armatimonadota bacterium]
MTGFGEREKVAHLLRRFGLGASEAELDFYGQDGYKGALDRLLSYASVADPVVELDRFANDKGLVNVKGVQAWFYTRLLVTNRPLEAALVVFWHNHFATSADKVDAVGALHDHVECLYTHCAGKFQDLLTGVSKDPAMLYWLDNHENKKGKPNENFAREVMELFTLGIGHYTETDVQEAARALTGWTYGVKRGQRTVETPKPAQRPKLKVEQPGPRIQFLFRSEQHDSGEKSILGNRGAFDGDDVLGILTGNPRTAVFLAEKAWSWFAYPNPERAVVERVAKAFRDSGMDVKALVRAIAESPEFLSEKCVRHLVKNPVVYCLSSLRQLGVGAVHAKRLAEDEALKGLRAAGPAAIAMLATKSMGMELLYPPDVSGWKSGEAWISSATMVERLKWSERLFGEATVARGAAKGPAKLGGQSLRYPAMGLFADDPTPAGTVDRLLSVFDVTLPEQKRAQLRKAADDASEGAVSPSNANNVASAVCRLVFSSPEFQFC